jgi:hypothetical protein
MEENSMIKVHIYSDTDKKQEIKTRQYDKTFRVYKKNGKLGIDWNTENHPYLNDGDVFVPLKSFSSTSVTFEDTETGKLYIYSNITNEITEIV